MRRLTLSLSERSLIEYLINQLNLFYPDNNRVPPKLIEHCSQLALKRIRKCFDAVNLKYYIDGRTSYFNHLHGDHYAAFLYLMSAYVYKEDQEAVAAKIFLLNKAMFGLDAFYAVELPEHFLFVHPLGTVIGNATYSDFFVVYQGVTIGSTTDGVYPTFSTSTILYANSSIIGKCVTGSNFVLAANASLINKNIAANKVVLGNYPNLKVIENKNNLISNYFQC